MRVYERQYVRAVYRRDIRLKTDEYSNLLARCENISAGGLGIYCDQITAQVIMPPGYQLSPEKPLLLSVELDLAGAEFRATCSVQNSYRLSQDKFNFNLKFISFEGNGQENLEAFLKQQSTSQ